MTIDPVALAAALVRIPSVTPDCGAALDLCERLLAEAGFSCTRLPFASAGAEVDNLVATAGAGRPHLVLSGHLDTVPPGDPGRWSVPPFAGEIREGRLFGRGAADMKSGVAAMIAAAIGFLERHPQFPGRLSLFLTGDEEGPAVDGTARILRWATERGLGPDACLVGEPTSVETLGDLAKIGRRGSLTGRLRVLGRQGHTAYPERAENAAHRLVSVLQALLAVRLDEGTPYFPPSSLQIASIDIGNPASNVIPGEASALFNVRFNDRHEGSALERRLRALLDALGIPYELEVTVAAEPFRTAEGPLTEMLAEAIERVTGRRPRFDTSGGTSDARFFAASCPVVEFGLPGPTMHQVDEQVRLADIEGLARIYGLFLERFFLGASAQR
ncbi:MAG: succinyl-diaminopimelate desuccinylase [Geminicoccaceae bacterium]|nr:succinyl-diaminopimelate desuccinylase [Geminicoccaceae bacterium]MCX7629912.1 succinyl-diaminopimelate desuccinylase [Geminicoccaceae bacterium]